MRDILDFITARSRMPLLIQIPPHFIWNSEGLNSQGHPFVCTFLLPPIYWLSRKQAESAQ